MTCGEGFCEPQSRRVLLADAVEAVEIDVIDVAAIQKEIDRAVLSAPSICI